MNHRKKEIGRKLQIVLLSVLFVAAAVMAAAIYLSIKNQPVPEEEHGGYNDRLLISNECVEWNGVTYRPRPNITTILLLGIDPDTEKNGSIDYRHGGQADFQQVIVLDHSKKTISRLEIDRDTITEIKTLTVLGKDAGLKKSQICLAHSFGDGKAESCEYALFAVNNLLGTDVNWYYSINLDGISVLNDYVGGVEVTIQDDLSLLDPAMVPGAVLTLHGKQTEYFVRSRMSVADGTNVNRMNRQREYMRGLAVKLDQLAHSGENAMAALFDVLDPYVVTNLVRGRIINELWRARDYETSEPIQLAGRRELDSMEHVAVYLDEDQVKQVVLDLLYEPLK